MLRDQYLAPTREEDLKAFSLFVESFGAKYLSFLQEMSFYVGECKNCAQPIPCLFSPVSQEDDPYPVSYEPLVMLFGLSIFSLA